MWCAERQVNQPSVSTGSGGSIGPGFRRLRWAGLGGLRLGQRIRRRVDPALEDERGHRRSTHSIVSGEGEGSRRARCRIVRRGEDLCVGRRGVGGADRGAEPALQITPSHCSGMALPLASLPPPSTLPAAPMPEPAIVMGDVVSDQVPSGSDVDAVGEVLVGGVAARPQPCRSGRPRRRMWRPRRRCRRRPYGWRRCR